MDKKSARRLVQASVAAVACLAALLLGTLPALAQVVPPPPPACDTDGNCDSTVTVTETSQGCTYRWDRTQFVVRPGKKPVLRWKLSNFSAFMWRNDGITLLDPNDRTKHLDGEGIEGANREYFVWLAVHTGPMRTRIEMKILMGNRLCTLQAGQPGYEIVLE